MLKVKKEKFTRSFKIFDPEVGLYKLGGFLTFKLPSYFDSKCDF